MNIWQTIILAIVEGITEFLPISSTGHLILVGNLIKVGQSEFVKSYEIAIQLGAIMAVVWETFRSLKSWEIIKRIGAAFVPTGVIGLLLYKLIKGFLLGNVWVTIVALLVGGIILIWLEKFKLKKADLINTSRKDNKINSKDRIQDLSYPKAALIGVVQSLSVIPGVSRAAATIIGGMGVGLSREEATQFSFMLAIPTMAAATGLDLIKSGGDFNSQEWGLIGLGTVVAFSTALVTVKWLIRYVKKHDFVGFGVYRIILAIVYSLVFWV